jgi:hypothetical protein
MSTLVDDTGEGSKLGGHFPVLGIRLTIDLKDAKKKFFSFIFFLITCPQPQAHHQHQSKNLIFG